MIHVFPVGDKFSNLRCLCNQTTWAEAMDAWSAAGFPTRDDTEIRCVPAKGKDPA